MWKDLIISSTHNLQKKTYLRSNFIGVSQLFCKTNATNSKSVELRFMSVRFGLGADQNNDT